MKILFVCLGNICRSPAAQAVMQRLVNERRLCSRFEIDSAGTYAGHCGQLPDRRMRVHATRRGYSLTHRARPVRPSDFDEADLIVAMDDANYWDLRALAPSPGAQAKVVRMAAYFRSFPRRDCVPDPYYEGAEGFELVLDMLEDACAALLDDLTA